MKAKGDVTSVQAMTTMFLFGMCDCTVDSNVIMGDFSLVLEIFPRVWARARAIARVSGHALHPVL